GDCIRDRNVTVVQTCALPIWIGSLSWPVRGRFWCRWVWLFVCSTLWARLLAADWVVVLAVVVVDGVFHKSVRRCGCSCWPRCGWPRGLSAPLALALPVRLRRSVLRHSVGAWCVVVGALPTRGRRVAVVGVDGAGYVRVRCRGLSCWLRCGAWWGSGCGAMVRTSGVVEGVRGCGRACWPSSRSSGCLLVGGLCAFTGVAAPAGRRLGRLGRLGCLLVGDLCGAGVGLLSVRG